MSLPRSLCMCAFRRTGPGAAVQAKGLGASAARPEGGQQGRGQLQRLRVRGEGEGAVQGPLVHQLHHQISPAPGFFFCKAPAQSSRKTHFTFDGNNSPVCSCENNYAATNTQFKSR